MHKCIAQIKRGYERKVSAEKMDVVREVLTRIA
jgi:hypothetical protein